MTLGLTQLWINHLVRTSPSALHQWQGVTKSTMSLHTIEGVSFHLKPNRDVTEIMPPLRRDQRLEGGRTHLYICPLVTQQKRQIRKIPFLSICNLLLLPLFQSFYLWHRKLCGMHHTSDHISSFHHLFLQYRAGTGWAFQLIVSITSIINSELKKLKKKKIGTRVTWKNSSGNRVRVHGTRVPKTKKKILSLRSL